MTKVALANSRREDRPRIGDSGLGNEAKDDVRALCYIAGHLALDLVDKAASRNFKQTTGARWKRFASVMFVLASLG